MYTVGNIIIQSTIMDKILFERSTEIVLNWTGAENFDNWLCVIFNCYCKSLIFGRKTGHWPLSPLDFDYFFLVIPNLQRN